MSVINALLGGGNILSTLLNVASMIFPAAQLASSLLKAFTSMIQDVIKGALQEMVKSMGLPKFLADAISKLADQIFGGAKGGGAGADEAVKKETGSAMKQYNEAYAKAIIENTNEAQNDGSAENGKVAGGKGGWLVALARAFGRLADAAAKDLKDQGLKLNKENPSDMIEYQAKTQEFAQMMNTFINAVKTIGEAQSTAVRKG